VKRGQKIVLVIEIEDLCRGGGRARSLGSKTTKAHRFHRKQLAMGAGASASATATTPESNLGKVAEISTTGLSKPGILEESCGSSSNKSTGTLVELSILPNDIPDSLPRKIVVRVLFEYLEFLKDNASSTPLFRIPFEQISSWKGGESDFLITIESIAPKKVNADGLREDNIRLENGAESHDTSVLTTPLGYVIFSGTMGLKCTNSHEIVSQCVNAANRLMSAQQKWGFSKEHFELITAATVDQFLGRLKVRCIADAVLYSIISKPKNSMN
jgi:hypothetical protein